jgi:hypothetical protein
MDEDVSLEQRLETRRKLEPGAAPKISPSARTSDLPIFL